MPAVETLINADRFLERNLQGVSLPYASGTNQDPILVSLNKLHQLRVSFDVAGSALVQVTNASWDDIRNSRANVTWKDWDNGTVTADSVMNVSGITAVRLNRPAAGTPRLTVAPFSYS